jgi:hypothetical protein
MATGEAGTDRALALVSGYHKHSYPPPEAYDAGLRRRFAIVLDTYRQDYEGIYFDTELFLGLVTEVFRTIPHDRMAITMWEGNAFDSVEALAQSYCGMAQDDRDPPARVRLFRGADMVCLVETEFWAYCGGPWPYHDSYTVSLYTAEDRSPELRAVCEDLCSRLGTQVAGFHTGEPCKEPFVRWWRRLLRLFGAKPW